MNLKLVAVAMGAITLMVVVLTGAGGSTASALSGLILVFVLPGYALTKLLFPGDNLELAEFVALVLGLSLAVAALGGLVLYLLPWKLEARSWTALLGCITLLASIGALVRDKQLNDTSRSYVKVNVSLSLGHGFLFVLAGIGLASAFALAYRGEGAQNSSDFTQLWIRPDDAEASAVVVGINNHATTMIRYRLLIKLDHAVVGEISPIELQSGETWSHSFSLPEGGNSVTAQLYRLYQATDPCNGENPPGVCQQEVDIYREVLLSR